MRRGWLNRPGLGGVRRALVATLAGLAVVAGPAAAIAAELSLEEPAACLTEGDLSFRVERLLGQPLGGVASMQLSVRIEPTPQGFSARLELSRPGGERGARFLRAVSCAELSEALALAIVVAIGPLDGPDEPAPVRYVPLEPAPASAEAAPVDAAAASPPEPATRGPAIAGSAWMVGDTGTLPVPGLGLATGVGVFWPGFGLRAMATWLPEREGNLDGADASPPGASIGLLAGSALACVPIAVNASDIGLDACAGWELGQLSGSGTDVSVPYHQRRLWSAARLDLQGRWAVPDTALAIELLVTAAAPFTRDDFIVKDLGSIHRPANVVGRFGVGVSLSIGR